MEVEGLKKMIMECKGKIDEKDREISDIKASINSLEWMV